MRHMKQENRNRFHHRHQRMMIVMHQHLRIPMHPMDPIRNQAHPMMNIMPYEKFQRKKFIDVIKAR